MKDILLRRYLSQCEHQAFVWGHHDCGTFVGRWIELLTGRNYWASCQCKSKREFQDLIQKEANGCLVTFMSKRFGSPLRGHTCAQRGDIAVLEVNDEQALGIVTGRHIATPGIRRLRRARLNQAVNVWRIECRQP